MGGQPESAREDQQGRPLHGVTNTAKLKSPDSAYIEVVGLIGVTLETTVETRAPMVA